jgi:hypothetical protein
MKELTIPQVLSSWFRYEPKEETRAAKRKFQDERAEINRLLNDGVNSGELRHRVETIKRQQDVHPNVFGEFATEHENERYRGRPYTKEYSVKTPYISPPDLVEFLQKINRNPPKDSPLAKKLSDCERPSTVKVEAEPLNTQEETPITNNANDYSGLLVVPKRVDGWFQAIDDMAKGYHDQHGEMPNEIQAWVQLCKNPPPGYEITQGKDKGEDCLNAPTLKPLGRKAFAKRWKKYTDKPH